jgi:uncharacterized membrane protein
MRGHRAALSGSPLGIVMLFFAIIVVLYFFFKSESAEKIVYIKGAGYIIGGLIAFFMIAWGSTFFLMK